MGKTGIRSNWIIYDYRTGNGDGDIYAHAANHSHNDFAYQVLALLQRFSGLLYQDLFLLQNILDLFFVGLYFTLFNFTLAIALQLN